MITLQNVVLPQKPEEAGAFLSHSLTLPDEFPVRLDKNVDVHFNGVWNSIFEDFLIDKLQVKELQLHLTLRGHCKLEIFRSEKGQSTQLLSEAVISDETIGEHFVKIPSIGENKRRGRFYVGISTKEKNGVMFISSLLSPQFPRVFL